MPRAVKAAATLVVVSETVGEPIVDSFVPDGPVTVLDALAAVPSLGDPAASNIPTGTPPAYALVALDRIHPAATNPRAADPRLADPDLAESIRLHGVLEPLIIIPFVDETDLAVEYQILAGHRRWAAAQVAGLTEVPAVIRQDLEPADRAADVAVLRLVENLQRRDLDPVEEARAFDQLLKVHGMSQADVATQVGRNQGHVSKRLKMLALGDVGLQLVVDGHVNLEDAVDLARMPAAVREDLVTRLAESGGVLNAAEVIASARLKLDELAERGRVIKQLKADKVPFLDRAVDSTDIPAGTAAVTYRIGHETCPNRFIVVQREKTWGSGPMKVWTTEYCTDIDSHKAEDEAAYEARQLKREARQAVGTGDADDEQKTKWNDLQKQAAARREQTDAVADARSAAVVALLSGKTPKGAAEFIAQATIAVSQYTHRGGEVMVAVAPQAWRDAFVPGIADEAVWAAAHGDIATKWALATWCQMGEYELAGACDLAVAGDDDRHGLCTELAELYALLLTTHGYELHPLEEAALGMPLVEDEPVTAEEIDEYDTPDDEPLEATGDPADSIA